MMLPLFYRISNCIISPHFQVAELEAECAAECLSTIGCYAFDLKDGICTISDECDADGFVTNKWFVRKGHNKESLNIKTPKKKKSKKRRRKKKGGAAPPAAEA